MTEKWDDIENALNFIARSLKVSRSKARRLLHRYICKGLCDWYRSRAYEEGFAFMLLSEDQRRIVEEALTKFVTGKTLEEKTRRAHKYICPSEPCSE